MAFRFLFLFSLILLSTKAQAGIGAHLGTHFGYGQIGNESGSLQDRSVSTIDFQAMPGYSFGNFMLGALGEYRFVNELENNPSGGVALSGNSYLLGLGGLFTIGPWKALASYDFLARHTLKNSDTHYLGSGIHILTGFEYFYGLRFDLQYSLTRYNKSKSPSGSSNLDSDKLTHWNLAFGLSYGF